MKKFTPKQTLCAVLLASTLLATPFFLTAKEEDGSAKKEDYVVLSVAGEAIKKTEVQKLLTDVFPGQEVPDLDSDKVTPETRDNILRNIATERLLLEEAKKKGTDKDEAVEKQVEALRRQIIIREYLQAKSKELVKEDELKKKYEEMIAGKKDEEEVKARHILVKTEEEAKKIYDEIKKGGDFTKIAEEKSNDPGSKASGGDLGYFTKDRMVPEFATAAFALKKGEVSQPVKSAFGWHVIKVEDRRSVEPPKFEDMKPQLEQALSGKAVQNYINGLLKDNKAVYYDAKGEAKPIKIYEDKAATPAPAAGQAKPE